MSLIESPSGNRYAFLKGPVALLLIAAASVVSVFFQGFSARTIFVEHLLCQLALFSILFGLYRERVIFTFSFIPSIVFLLWLWELLSIAWAPVHATSVFTFSLCAIFPMVFFVSVACVSQNKLWVGIWRVILFLAIISSIYAVLQFYEPKPFQHILHRSFYRSREPLSFFVNKNSFAAFVNLVLFPYLSYAIIKKTDSFLAALRWACIFLFMFSIGLTTSRGALLSMTIGFLIMLLVLHRRVPKPALIAFVLAFVLAFVFAYIETNHFVFLKSFQFSNIYKSPRLLIWEGSFNFLQATPWYGSGIGSFMIHYPAYALPGDITSRQYAHNDFLQIAIELGLPGLLLILSLLCAMLWRFTRFLKCSPSHTLLVEVTGLFCGLCTTVIHSVFSYNFYVLPILLLFGIFLGRLYVLTMPFFKPLFTLSPKQFLSKRGYHAVLFSILILVLFLQSVAPLSNHYYTRAYHFYLQGDFVHSMEALDRAARLFDSARIQKARATLYFNTMKALPESDLRSREALFRESVQALQNATLLYAKNINYRYILGTLYMTYPQYTEDAQKLAMVQFKAGFEADPASDKNRLAYAKELMKLGRAYEAMNVLEQGLVYGFSYHADAKAYLDTLAQLQGAIGDKQRARFLRTEAVIFKQERLHEIKRSNGAFFLEIT